MAAKTPLIQDIFRTHGPAYLQRYGPKMPFLHKKALYAIMNCRSPELGGEVYWCAGCQKYHYSYHSCGNRHCVVCGNGDAGRWIEKHKEKLLPFTYFLTTFTIPGQLRALCRANQKLFYDILFRASSTALKTLAGDKKYLGAQIGMTGILHTWSRALAYHPHVHYLVPGGGITDEMKKVRFSEDNFLVHVRPLSIIFKAKFRDALKAKAPDIFTKINPKTWSCNWVVHIKPVGSGDKALEYMGRYLFRVAISNNRIIRLHNAKVTFRYTDYKSGKNRIVTVDAFEFIRRFLQHVLPHNFMKVRYYGFLAAASRKKLAGLRKMLFMDEKPRNDTLPTVTVKTLLCPVCGTQLVWVRTLHRGADYDP